MCDSDRSIAIGPEGGWADDEISIAPESISLSPQVLRVETAAVVAATLMAAHRG
jgi:RsmE family RNA methyltransferase